MPRLLFLFVAVTLFSTLSAQTIVNFEELEVPVDSFFNGSNGEGLFTTKGITLPNDFTPEFQSWTGWSISTKTDTLTPGFMNQYSAIAGSGHEESLTYAVSFEFGENKIYMENGPQQLSGLSITNATYAYLSMRDGDSFTKQFGGETGDDPDFFLLQIIGYQGESLTDTVDFYLADFRFEDNSEDYIVDDWTFADLSDFGPVDSLGFILSSSDNGQFGMNTPAYFCVDQVIFSEETTTPTAELLNGFDISIFPNPVTDAIRITIQNAEEYQANLLSVDGTILDSKLITSSGVFDMHHLPSGMYLINIQSETSYMNQLITKR